MTLKTAAIHGLTAFLACSAMASASAALITFSGGDNGVAAGGARPSSDAAAASFDTAAAALGAVGLIDFENMATGSPASAMVLASGVTYTPSNPDSFSGIFDTNSTNLGYNTTSGGSKHLRYSSGTAGALDAVFSFATPIQAFGAYFTGVGNGTPAAADILFDNGTSQSFTLIDQSDGGVQFFGFTDSGALISSITIRGNTEDVLGIDDIRFVNGVPEPGTLALLGLGLAGLAATRRRKQ